jgi:hypothetical protein
MRAPSQPHSANRPQNCHPRAELSFPRKIVIPAQNCHSRAKLSYLRKQEPRTAIAALLALGARLGEYDNGKKARGDRR